MNRILLTVAVSIVIILSLLGGLYGGPFLDRTATITTTSFTTEVKTSTSTITITNSTSITTSSMAMTTTTNSSSTSLVSSQNLSVLGPITYPANYGTLANYSLGLINKDRLDFGLSAVTLSPIESAQQHADSMLMLHYFSHWDTQGYKPYMRYTLLNGTGFVEENIAYMYTSQPYFLSTLSIEHALSDLEYGMMYNDSICCNNGHRINILDPFHNRVSIGVAFDFTHVYFVENFENYYANFGRISYGTGNQIELSGSTSEALTPFAVLVYHDSYPDSLDSSILNSEFQGAYDQGNFTGGVLPACDASSGCLAFSGHTTVYASNWQMNASSINIQFALTKFVQQYGSGVYTLYMVQGNQTNPQFLTSISVFVP